MQQLLIILSLLISSFITFAQIKPQIRAVCKARVNGINYEAICFDDEHIMVKNGSGKTVLNISAYGAAGFQSFRFTDFNGDGYKDLLIEYMTNTPGVCNLYLYQATNQNFVKIEGFDNYPAPLRIAGTNFLFSYHRSGCADMNWDSDLFIIKNYMPVKLGNISGNECGDSGIKDGIYIHKINGGKEILYKTIHISTIKRYKDYKWGFIASYWKKHHKEFLKVY